MDFSGSEDNLSCDGEEDAMYTSIHKAKNNWKNLFEIIMDRKTGIPLK